MVSKKKLAGLAAIVAVGAGIGVAAAYSKGSGGGGGSFICTCLTSSGVVASLPAGATSNGSVTLSYTISIGAVCAVNGEYLYLSPADAASLGVKSGYWLITSGGSGGLTLTVSPTSVAPGGMLSFSGSGFTPNGTVEVNASGVGFFQVYAVIKASAAGTVSGSVVIPSSAGAGAASFLLGDEGTSLVVSAAFTVT